jgi:hypothetical protein
VDIILHFLHLFNNFLFDDFLFVLVLIILVLPIFTVFLNLCQVFLVAIILILLEFIIIICALHVLDIVEIANLFLFDFLSLLIEDQILPAPDLLEYKCGDLILIDRFAINGNLIIVG